MEKQDILTALKKARELSGKRNFKQSFDMILTVKDLDLKKPDNQVDFFMSLNHPTGRDVKLCGLVGPEMADSSRKELDFTITSDEFDTYGKDKAKVKKVASKYDFFIAQANLMTKVASSFGRVFGPKNKMPNPKSGAVVPPNANLAQLKAKLKQTVRVLIKTSPQFQVCIGKEDIGEENIADNAMNIYTQLTHHLPNEEQNIRDVFLKMTMGPVVKVVSEKTLAIQEKKGSRK